MNPTGLTALLVDQDDGLLTVTLDRPRRKNAISSAMWNELDAVFTEAAVDPSVRAVVLTGADGNFSAGADLSGEESNGLTGHGPQPIVHEMRVVGGIIGRIKGLAKPTIAAVDGVAVGVALGIALACDLVVATDRARFMEVFVKRGLALDGGTSWSIPNLIGARRAKQMAFFGDTVDAATALEWGLVNRVVPAADLESLPLDEGWASCAGPAITEVELRRAPRAREPPDREQPLLRFRPPGRRISAAESFATIGSGRPAGPMKADQLA